MTPHRHLSTAAARRDTVVASAVTVFAESGYASTPISAVATHARISPAYVFKLFPSKVSLFVAALDSCYDRIIRALEVSASKVDTEDPETILDAMGGAYADLIADRDLLMMQVHGQAATRTPEIADAVRRGISRVTSYAATRSRAETADVQRFLAFGQLCHLLTTIDAFGVDESWAQILSDGIRHVAPEGGEHP